MKAVAAVRAQPSPQPADAAASRRRRREAGPADGSLGNHNDAPLMKRHRPAAPATTAATTQAIDLSVIDRRCRDAIRDGDLDGALDDAVVMYRRKPESALGYLRATQIFLTKGMTEAASKILAIAFKKVDTNDPKYARLVDLRLSLSTEAPKGPSASKRAPEKTSAASEQLDVPTAESPASPPNSAVFGAFQLPAELVLAILRRLPFVDRCRCLGVSRALRALVASDRGLWTELDFGAARSARVTDRAVAAVLGRAGASVRAVRLGGCVRLTRAALRPLSSPRRPLLRELVLAGASKIGGEDLADMLVGALGGGGGGGGGGAGRCALEVLDLSGTNITTAGLVRVLGVTGRLRRLVVARCGRLTAEVFTGATLPAELEAVDVSETAAGDAALAALARACGGSLRSVEAVRCRALGARGLAALRRCPRLCVLRCSWAGGVTADAAGRRELEAALLAVAAGASAGDSGSGGGGGGLEVFAAAGLPGLTDAAVAGVAGLSAGLRELDLSSCAHVGDAAVMAVSRRCGSLRRAVLARCPRVSEAGLAALAGGCPRLRALDVSENPDAMSDSVLRTVATHARELEELRLAACGRVTGAGLVAFAEELSRATPTAAPEHQQPGPSLPRRLLKLLDVSFCDGVGVDTIRRLAALLPGTKIASRKA
ncbi:hypothetical protein HK405_014705 [Cladochytrium tenue]|nr:hypothetical protein HK405_014705 [Cladochytrium tenue]